MINALTIEESLSYLLKNNSSVIRIGSDEVQLIHESASNNLSESNTALGIRLRNIIEGYTQDSPYVLAMPRTIFHQNELLTRNNSNYKDYCACSRYRNYDSASLLRQRIERMAPRGILYLDSLISRCHSENTDPKLRERALLLWGCVFMHKDITIIEGEYTRFGVGNNLLRNTKSVQRILVPHKDAWQEYDSILKECRSKIPKEHLVLTAIDPVAKILAYDLSKDGYRVLDVGRLDMEYEWNVRGVNVGTHIRGKYQKGTVGNPSVYPIDNADDANAYYESIIARIEAQS